MQKNKIDVCVCVCLEMFVLEMLIEKTAGTCMGSHHSLFFFFSS